VVDGEKAPPDSAKCIRARDYLASRLGVDRHGQPAHQCFSRGCRDAHVSQKADQLDRVGTFLLEPGAQLGAGQRAVDGLDENGLTSCRLEPGR